MKDAVMMTEDREGEELCRPLDPYGHCWPWEKEQGIAHGSDISQWLQCGDVPVDYFRSRLIFYSSSHAPHYYSKCNSRLMSWRIVTSVLRLGQKKICYVGRRTYRGPWACIRFLHVMYVEHVVSSVASTLCPKKRPPFYFSSTSVKS